MTDKSMGNYTTNTQMSFYTMNIVGLGDFILPVL